jgi:hypothetical protein
VIQNHNDISSVFANQNALDLKFLIEPVDGIYQFGENDGIKAST